MAEETSEPQTAVQSIRRDPQRFLLKFWAWVPIPLLLLSIAALSYVNLQGSYESPFLMMALNCVFSVLASLCVAWLLGRSFLSQGKPGLLLLGCGIILWGAAGVVAIAASLTKENGLFDINTAVSIHNICVWFSAICHLVGVVLSLRIGQAMRARAQWLAAAYALALVTVGLVTISARSGLLPIFFREGQGGTMVRQVVLASAIATFVLTTALLRAGTRSVPLSIFSQWYALALGLVATGLFGVMMERGPGSNVSWLGRGAQFLSGIYMLMAALAAARESASPAVPFKETLSKARYKYGVAIVIVLAATAVRLLFFQVLGTTVAFITFYPAVMLAALYGGLRGGLLATVLSGLLANYFWMEPVHHFLLEDPTDWMAMAIFLLSGTMISWLTESMQRAQARASAAETQFQITAARQQDIVALHESEERYRSLFEHMLDGYAYCRMVYEDGSPRDFIYLNVNHAFEQLTGLKNVIGKYVSEVIPGIHRSNPELLQIYGRVALNGQPEKFETRLESLGIWFSVSVFSPQKEHFVAAFENITERKRTEEKLCELTQRLTYHVDNSPLAVIEWGPDMRLSRWSGAAERVFGWKAEEVLGKRMEDFRWIYEEDKSQVATVSVDLQTGTNTHRFSENRNYHKNGSVLRCEWYNSSLLDESGKLRSILSLVLDVTKRKQAEEALQQSEAQFRALSDSIPNLAWWADGNGYLTWYNQRWYEYTGTTPEQMEGWGWQSVHDPKMLPQVLERWKASIASGESFDMEFPLRGADGRFRWFLTRVLPLKDSAGKVLRWFGTNTDISDIRAAREVLSRSKEELELLVSERTARLQELVGELEHFSYTITHDMRAPLRAMRGFAEIINEYCADCPQKEPGEFLRRISVSADRMDNLITDALNYNRAVRQELPLEPVDICALLRGMLDSYPEFQASRAHIQIEGDFPLVMGNEAGLTQCFSNLLGNAVKFVKPGQIPEIRVWAEKQDGWAQVWVEDKGIGIPELMLTRVFDMFSRGHKTYGGTGIGLALVRKVMDRMGGKVGVESEEGKGSRFWLKLKLA